MWRLISFTSLGEDGGLEYREDEDDEGEEGGKEEFGLSSASVYNTVEVVVVVKEGGEGEQEGGDGGRTMVVGAWQR